MSGTESLHPAAGKKLRPYNSYKQTGIRWFSSIPESWSISKVKFDSYVKARVGWHGLKSDEFTDTGPYLITGTDFTVDGVNWGSAHHCTKERYAQDPYIQLKDDDLLLTKDGTIGKVTRVGKLPGKACLNSGIFVVRAINNSYLPQYFYWILRSTVFNEFITFNKTGSTINHLYQDTFEQFSYCKPSPEEQHAIAAFLDHETARIDQLIAKQQRLIALLKEKRQAVISHAVTKGLPSITGRDAPMKDSGVEWLGEVPEHWGVFAINQAIQKITNGYVGPTRDILVETGTPYIQATHIKNGKVNFDGEYFVTKDWSLNHKKSILRKGDVLVVQTGAGTGDIGLVSEEEEGFNCHALIILQPIPEKLLGDYLSLVLSSSYGQAVLYSVRTGGMHPHLNCSEVKFVKIPVPPVADQQAIVQSVQESTKKYNSLMELAQKQVKLLQERRTALISAAVTGKIDVRNWTPDAQAPEQDQLMAAEPTAEYRV
ncbi:restriction endonuclease subunit S [Marinobacter xestospongiae]|uniref:Restriction endonuclease subunit S n=1 Tax=Marinobacter xestospongiae TaxID=994319 RepID=A0ABU3VSE1_9GAMM|nr:restriction endonuclease subunit S [Marinobacter xestospongiae]MDV2077186.1 restriction endonuclease subunit S [Marinobacter xestospongiae]